MYEIDFTGWIRTPEAISLLRNNKWKRLRFHFRHLYLSILYMRGWYDVKYYFKDFVTNTKAL